ncbi:metal-dependent hydrolase [Candidatus Pacearchaeota archaeon]|nr:metal-dependent hydrolase [Candidatus Pacearchaeota archaeon]
MPLAVTHIIFPILLFSLIRDYYLKKGDREKFQLHYVLIVGIGGVLPDIDIPISFILNFLGITSWDVHYTFTHSLFLPLSLFVLFLIFNTFNLKAKLCNISRHKLKLSLIFLMLAIGTLIHIILDASFQNFLDLFSTELRSYIPATLDGILLVIWIIYLEIKHKISGFI